uniref:Large ribosomal subunit protein bL12c n=1 Tax=Eutreptiella sp. CCMP389 TaxID=96781 RepID=A0A977K881_9EUGL|nr:ribosomal protein L12 [Eutreptiella sp. CCMP389]
MSTKANEILEQLKNITLLEAAELVAKIEETFDVDSSVTSGGGMMINPAALSTTSEATQEEKTEFDLILEEVPTAKRIAVIKAVRSLDSSLSLKDAKGLIETLPKAIKEAISKEEAEDAKKLLEEAGGKTSIK